MDNIRKQLGRGRPRKAGNEANLPEKPLQPKTPKAPSLPPTGELPKDIIGSHMGHVVVPSVAVSNGPVIRGPAKLGPRMRKAPLA